MKLNRFRVEIDDRFMIRIFRAVYAAEIEDFWSFSKDDSGLMQWEAHKTRETQQRDEGEIREWTRRREGRILVLCDSIKKR